MIRLPFKDVQSGKYIPIRVNGGRLTSETAVVSFHCVRNTRIPVAFSTVCLDYSK